MSLVDDEAGDKSCEELARRYLALLDEALVSWGVDVVNRLALRHRLAPFHVALTVPGLCHAHAPDTRPAVHGCAYCKRRGNCFASDQEEGQTRDGGDG